MRWWGSDNDWDGDYLPKFKLKIDILRKVGRRGLELSWQALLQIGVTYMYCKMGGFEDIDDGPDEADQDNFHWDIDILLLECCIDIEAQTPETLDTERRIRDMEKLRKKVTGSYQYPNLAYRYFFTVNYLRWVQGGKVGDYETPARDTERLLDWTLDSPRPSMYKCAFKGREDLVIMGDKSAEA